MRYSRKITQCILCAVVIMIAAQLISSCASSLPVPNDDDVHKYSLESNALNELITGRELYIAKCSGCHSLHLPQQFTASSWDTILASMKPRAKINEKESGLIRAYVNLYAADRQKK